MWKKKITFLEVAKDRQYALTQRPSKQFNIELNKRPLRISDTRELCVFVLTHAAEFDHECGHSFPPSPEKPGIPLKALAQALETLEESALQNIQDFGAHLCISICAYMCICIYAYRNRGHKYCVMETHLKSFPVPDTPVA